jgi:hypothetical protein
MSATRLAPSIRQDLSLVQPSPTSSAPRTAVTLTSALSLVTPSTAGPSRERSHLPSSFLPPAALTTLRKSYRRVLSLSSGLRVRMRTLFLPQLLPVRDPDESPSLGESGGADGERRIVLCVEIENPSEGVQIDGFEIEGVTVDVGGKGAKATAELVCQPEQKNGVFPLRLRPVEQYNLLYAVNISSSPDATGKGDEQRPIAITVIGRPYIGETYPTSTFHSRWNCTLDLSFYASLFAPPTAPPQVRNSLTKPITSPTAVVAGDKRYSLASLNSDRSNPHRAPLRPVVSSGVNGRVPSCRGPQQPISDPSSGLLVSVKLLPPSPEGRSTVRVLEPFSVEVFVHNRTDEVRRFKLSLPGRDGGAGKVREASQKRRRRRADEPAWGADDPGE